MTFRHPLLDAQFKALLETLEAEQGWSQLTDPSEILRLSFGTSNLSFTVHKDDYTDPYIVERTVNGVTELLFTTSHKQVVSFFFNYTLALLVKPVTLRPNLWDVPASFKIYRKGAEVFVREDSVLYATVPADNWKDSLLIAHLMDKKNLNRKHLTTQIKEDLEKPETGKMVGTPVQEAPVAVETFEDWQKYSAVRKAENAAEAKRINDVFINHLTDQWVEYWDYLNAAKEEAGIQQNEAERLIGELQRASVLEVNQNWTVRRWRPARADGFTLAPVAQLKYAWEKYQPEARQMWDITDLRYLAGALTMVELAKADYINEIEVLKGNFEAEELPSTFTFVNLPSSNDDLLGYLTSDLEVEGFQEDVFETVGKRALELSAEFSANEAYALDAVAGILSGGVEEWPGLILADVLTGFDPKDANYIAFARTIEETIWGNMNLAPDTLAVIERIRYAVADSLE